MENNYDAARTAAGTFTDIFGKDNFFLEIQDQGLEMENRITPGLFKLEKDPGLPLVATNDCHYLRKETPARTTSCCASRPARPCRDPNRMKFDTARVLSQVARRNDAAVRRDSPKCLDRTLDIAAALQRQAREVAEPVPAVSTFLPDTPSTATSSTSRARDLRSAASVWRPLQRSRAS